MAERSKARVCGRSLVEIAGLNPAGGMDVCVVCKDRRNKRGQSRQTVTEKVQRVHKRRNSEKKNPDRGKNLFVLQIVQIGSGAQPVFHSVSAGVSTLFLRVKFIHGE